LEEGDELILLLAASRYWRRAKEDRGTSESSISLTYLREDLLLAEEEAEEDMLGFSGDLSM